jgi:glycosyltransferase involved in cell wall biosynthesis
VVAILKKIFSRKSRPPVTFVVPAYDAADTIVESLRSILDNMESRDELIVVDDCSKDDTAEVVQKFIDQNTKFDIQLIRHKYNKSDGGARNTGIEASANELVFALDADNILADGSITPLVKKMQRDKADVASFQELYYFKDSIDRVEMKWHFPDDVKYDIAYHLSHFQTPSASGNYLIRKESWTRFGRYPEYAGALNNWGFGLAQAVHNTNTVVLKNSFYYHRYGHESLWVRDEKAGKVPYIALQLLLPFLDLINDKDVDYIFSKAGRFNWFSNLEMRPIRPKKRR